MGDIKNKLLKLNFSRNTGGSYINLDFSDLGDKLEEAQHQLDFMVLRDMLKYVPSRGGRLAEEIVEANNNAPDGVVVVYPNTLPYGHYQWEGEKYVWGSSGAYKGGKKIPSGEPLHYRSASAERHWDEAVIRDCKDKWIEAIQRMFK